MLVIGGIVKLHITKFKKRLKKHSKRVYKNLVHRWQKTPVLRQGAVLGVSVLLGTMVVYGNNCANNIDDDQRVGTRTQQPTSTSGTTASGAGATAGTSGGPTGGIPVFPGEPSGPSGSPGEITGAPPPPPPPPGPSGGSSTTVTRTDPVMGLPEDQTRVVSGGSTCRITDVNDPIDDAGVDANCDGVDGVASHNIYVRAVGGSDSYDGVSGNTPVVTLQRAYEIARATGRRNILMAAGNYRVVDVRLQQGVHLYGGYAADFRSRSLQSLNTLISNGVNAEQFFAGQVALPTNITRIVSSLYLNGRLATTFSPFSRDIFADTHISGLVLTSDVASSTTAGAASIGLVCTNCPGLRLERLVVLVSRGKNGGPGKPGVNGAAGINGMTGTAGVSLVNARIAAASGGASVSPRFSSQNPSLCRGGEGGTGGRGPSDAEFNTWLEPNRFLAGSLGEAITTYSSWSDYDAFMTTRRAGSGGRMVLDIGVWSMYFDQRASNGRSGASGVPGAAGVAADPMVLGVVPFQAADNSATLSLLTGYSGASGTMGSDGIGGNGGNGGGAGLSVCAGTGSPTPWNSCASYSGGGGGSGGSCGQGGMPGEGGRAGGASIGLYLPYESYLNQTSSIQNSLIATAGGGSGGSGGAGGVGGLGGAGGYGGNGLTDRLGGNSSGSRGGNGGAGGRGGTGGDGAPGASIGVVGVVLSSVGYTPQGHGPNISGVRYQLGVGTSSGGSVRGMMLPVYPHQ